MKIDCPSAPSLRPLYFSYPCSIACRQYKDPVVVNDVVRSFLADVLNICIRRWMVRSHCSYHTPLPSPCLYWLLIEQLELGLNPPCKCIISITHSYNLHFKGVSYLLRPYRPKKGPKFN